MRGRALTSSRTNIQRGVCVVTCSFRAGCLDLKIVFAVLSWGCASPTVRQCRKLSRGNYTGRKLFCMSFGSITSEQTQLPLSGILQHLRKHETLRTTPGAARQVPSLSRYAPDFKFPPSQARFTSPSGYTRPLGLRTWFLGSFKWSASFGAPLAPPSALVALGSTMSSSSPTLTFCLVASFPELRLARSLPLLKALNEGFPTSTGVTREIHSLSRYVPYSGTSPSPTRFASDLGSTWPLGSFSWTSFMWFN